MSSAEHSYQILTQVLADNKMFAGVVNAVFTTLDKNGTGTLELGDLENFIAGVCREMGIDELPGKGMIQALFEELDEDQHTALSIDELARFLKIFFEEQKRHLEKRHARRQRTVCLDT